MTFHTRDTPHKNFVENKIQQGTNDRTKVTSICIDRRDKGD